MKRILATIVTAFTLAAAALTAHGAEPVDPATAKAVKELLVQMKFREQMANGLQRAYASLPQVMLKAQTDRINNNPKLTDDQKKAELAIVSNDIPKTVMNAQRMISDPKLADEVMDEVVPLYARQFTLAELNEIIAFYKTPTAAKMQKLLPQITQEANQATQALLKARFAKLVEQSNQTR